MDKQLLEQIQKDIKALDQKMDRVLQYIDKLNEQNKNQRIKDAMTNGGRRFKKD